MTVATSRRELLRDFAHQVLETIRREDLGDVVQLDWGDFDFEWSTADEWRLARFIGEWLEARGPLQ